jgi:diguanylate cyclase (GGDEF)-like protein
MGNPVSWTMADRCLTISGLMLASTVIFVGVVLLAGGWPFVPVDAQDTELLRSLAPLMLVPWTLAVLAALWARKAAPQNAALVWLTTQLYSFSVALLTLTIGPFQSPGWVSYIGGVVVGYLLFPRWPARFGALSYVVIVITGALVLEARAWPLLERLVPEDSYAMLTRASILRLSITSLGFSAITLWLCAYVIDRWRDREARYQRMARTDGLTGLTNRRKFIETAERELGRARRYNASVGILLVDLDHFKAINDTRGHLAGDRVLAAAARTLAGAVRDVDTVARWGGEEFAVLLPETELEGAVEVAERCARVLREAVIDVGEGEPVRVTASVGVTAARGPKAFGLDALVKRADDALYRAKENGRNRVEVLAA